MSGGSDDNGVLERECDGDHSAVPAGLDEDIRHAARNDVPVLITGLPDEGREIACAIDRQSEAPGGIVEVVDCRVSGALGRVMAYAPGHGARRPARRSSILLLQEVHALSLSEQAQFEQRLSELRITRRDEGIRIVVSSSAPLFERVREGSFGERLYYRLNVIHMIVA